MFHHAMRRWPRLAAAATLAVALSGAALPSWAEVPGNLVRIGVLTDMSGPFSDQVGQGSVTAARLALEDFAVESRGLKVDLVFGDHQNKPDVGLSIARRWLDTDGVAAIADLPNSAVALAVANLMKERNRVALASSAMTSDLTGKSCAPTTVQWVSDTWAQGQALASALAAQGRLSWYFLTVDYALGHALERDASQALAKAGGSVAGATRLPLGTADFAAPLLAAQSSGAQVLALANTGGDLINAVKQAGEFGLTSRMTVAPLFIQLSDVHSLGLDKAKGLRLVTGFYWDQDEPSRAFALRFAARMQGRMPTEGHAGVYSAVLAYLRAVRDAGTLEGAAVVARMRQAPWQDPLWGPLTIRRDGRVVHRLRLYEVKAPGESKAPYDYYRLVDEIPGPAAFRPADAGGCPLAPG